MEEELQQYFMGNVTCAEQRELLRKVSSDESFKKQFVELQNANALSTLYPSDRDEVIGKFDYAQFMERSEKKKARERLMQLATYAAGVALLIGVSCFATYSYFSHNTTSQAIFFNTVLAPAGQRSCVILQDGTKVWLNAQSKLTYPSLFSAKERRVELEGEGYFEVSKDTEKPFIVTSKEVEVKVLGTTFNIHSYPETGFVRTSLLEGSVDVSITTNSKVKNTIRLLPNQQAIVANGEIKVDNTMHKSYFLWKDGIYSFEKEPFRLILNKLELYYNVKIIVTDPSIADFVYTGKFRQQDGVYEILRIIQKIQRFSIRKDEHSNIITLSEYVNTTSNSNAYDNVK